MARPVTRPRNCPPLRNTAIEDVELVHLVLGPRASGTDCARRLLERAGSIGRLELLDPSELRGLPGCSPQGILRLQAALELGRRALLERTAQLLPVRSHQDVLEWALPRLVHLEHEELWLLCLDSKQRLRHAERVAQGGVSGCLVAPRDVLRPAVRNAAAAVVVVHNHPSGDPTPSMDDIHMTRQLARACDILGIPLLDHVVVGRQGSRSVALLDAA